MICAHNEQQQPTLLISRPSDRNRPVSGRLAESSTNGAFSSASTSNRRPRPAVAVPIESSSDGDHRRLEGVLADPTGVLRGPLANPSQQMR